MSITVRSEAFKSGAAIPKKYTEDGSDDSPPLSWKGVPEGAKELASPAGARQGTNSWKSGRTVGYRGPAPPKGHGSHHYHFHLYALDAPLSMEAKADKKKLLAAMKGHVLAEGEVVGVYERK